MTESPAQPFRDHTLPLDQRVDALLACLTLEEKVGLMMHEAKGVPRLGISDYNWWNEALHGVARASRATVFPQAIGLAAMFDEALLQRIASAIGDEGRAMHHAAARYGNRGQFFGLTYWSPNVNIFRDPRWGRGQECYGEDPVLTARLGTAFVRGLQGDHPRYLKAAACAKHYAVHSGPEALRHEFDARCSAYDLWDTYLPAFEALVKAGVEAVMGAYNRTNGEPCCAHSYLMDDVLRGRWQFQGHYVSDCWALRDFHAHHRVTRDPLESAALAVRRGCDLNCGSTYEHLPEAIKAGLVTEADVDPCVRRLLRTLFRLGFFDPQEEVPYAQIGPEVINCEAHREMALEAATKSIVLLKNNGILPLPACHYLLVTGTNAGSVDVLLGNYFGVGGRLDTVIEGLARRAPIGMKVEYRAAFRPEQENQNPVDYVPFEAARADVTIVAMGLTPWLEGEEGDALASTVRGDRPDPRLPPHQLAYLRTLKARHAKVVVLLFGGSAMMLEDALEHCDALLWVGYPGEAGGEAIAQVLFGDVNPAGRLPFTWYRHLDDLPPFADYSMRGRTYRYLDTPPMFPFGFGLSYTRFDYRDLVVTVAGPERDTVQVKATVGNAGDRAGEEVVQLYVRPVAPPMLMPKVALRDFRRVSLAPGQTVEVEFRLPREALQWVSPEGERVWVPGRYEIIVAACAPLPGGDWPAPPPLRAEVELG
jgi:beta-glucosidase